MPNHGTEEFAVKNLVLKNELRLPNCWNDIGEARNHELRSAHIMCGTQVVAETRIHLTQLKVNKFSKKVRLCFIVTKNLISQNCR